MGIRLGDVLVSQQQGSTPAPTSAPSPPRMDWGKLDWGKVQRVASALSTADDWKLKPKKKKRKGKKSSFFGI